MERRRLIHALGAGLVASLAGCPVPEPPDETTETDESTDEPETETGEPSDGTTETDESADEPETSAELRGENKTAEAPILLADEYEGGASAARRAAEQVTDSERSLNDAGSLQVSDGAAELSQIIDSGDQQTIYEVQTQLNHGGAGFAVGLTRLLAPVTDGSFIDGGVGVAVDGELNQVTVTVAPNDGEPRSYTTDIRASATEWVGVRLVINNRFDPTVNVRFWDASETEPVGWDFQLADQDNIPSEIDTETLSLWASTEVPQ